MNRLATLIGYRVLFALCDLSPCSTESQSYDSCPVAIARGSSKRSFWTLKRATTPSGAQAAGWYLRALARLIVQASQRTQPIVVSHAPWLVSALDAEADSRRFMLEKTLGETTVQDDAPWSWT